MTTIKLSDICPKFVKGFYKLLKYNNPYVHLIFDTQHEKLVKQGEPVSNEDSGRFFTLDKYETVDNDENILSLKIENYDESTDTNVQFENDHVIIDIVPNGQKSSRKEGRRCFMCSYKNIFIDITKYKYITLKSC